MRILKWLAPHRGWIALVGGLAVLMLVLAFSPAIRSLSQRAESYIQARSDSSVALPPFDELYSPEAVEYFLVAAFREHGPGAAEPDLPRLGFIYKWNQDINICVEGANDVDRLIVFWVIETVRPLIQPIEIAQVDCAEEYNFRVVFTSVRRFGDYVNWKFDTVDGRIFYGGTAAMSMENEGLISSAIALVNTDIPTDFSFDLKQVVRTGATWEEMSHGLGSIHDSYYDDQSLFYQGTNLVYMLSDIDQELIRILYDPRIEPGMRYCDVYQLLRSESSASFVASSAVLGAEGPDRC
ncbi:MAG: DUF2927 domain-containing protein [Chloroflexi bacterium]|nr:DUF2927 domain-containing protein [Chloroflexota bacterium]MCY3938651.1 DUF2927 domain-containing protein [Chloroflexota bacterium]